jgi:hypothetical protein
VDPRILFVGPAVNLFLAAALLFVRWYLGPAEPYIIYRSEIPKLAFFTQWVGLANLALAVVGVVPALPTAAGQALREARGFRAASRGTTALVCAIGGFGLLSFDPLLVVLAIWMHVARLAERPEGARIVPLAPARSRAVTPVENAHEASDHRLRGRSQLG